MKNRYLGIIKHNANLVPIGRKTDKDCLFSYISHSHSNEYHNDKQEKTHMHKRPRKFSATPLVQMYSMGCKILS